MPRPCKRRRVFGAPGAEYFKPAGVRLRNLEEVEISLAEFESLRLIDVERIAQEEAAKKMQVSQPTFSRVLSSAREKIAEALVRGKAIKITKE